MWSSILKTTLFISNMNYKNSLKESHNTRGIMHPKKPWTGISVVKYFF